MTNFTTIAENPQNNDHFAHSIAGGTWIADNEPQPERQRIGNAIYTTYSKGQEVDIATPEGYRALIVMPTPDGGHITKTVPNNASVLDIRADLTEHLDDLGLSNEWFLELSDWIKGKLEAREKAQAHWAAPKARVEAQS